MQISKYFIKSVDIYFDKSIVTYISNTNQLGENKMSTYQVISEEKETSGKVIFEGTLKQCYEFQRSYAGSKYPSISLVKWFN